MDSRNEDVRGVIEAMLVEPPMPDENERARLAEMYRCIVTGDENWRSCLDQNIPLLDIEFSIEHTTSCSCGRFFEQHPTTIDGVEGQLLEMMLLQIRTGMCSCLLNNDPIHVPRIAYMSASKTLLHAAAASAYQSTDILVYLLERKCRVNRRTSLHYYTPLFRAICSRNTGAIVELLKRDDIDVNLHSRSERHSPLLEAILNRYYPAVELLLGVPSIDLNRRNFRSETPIIVATRMGDLVAMEMLLKAGAYPDTRDHRDMTPLMFAVMYGSKKVTELLLSYGANLNLHTSSGETPLLMAVSRDSLEMTQLLLEKGANVNEVSNDSHPALMVATYSNHANIVRLLLDNKANLTLCNDMGYQSLHIAAWNGYLAILNLLLDAGAPSDVQTQDLNTPLSLAAHGDHLSVVEILIGHGCNVRNADKDLDTPLHYATFNGNVACMERLLRMGADPAALNRLTVTPLWNAVYQGHIIAVRILIKKNVALSVPSRGIEQHAQSDQVVTVFDTPRTPLWVACHQGFSEIALTLIAAGCDVVGETWIGLNQFPGKSAEMDELKNVLHYHYSIPRPLLFQCRDALRRMAGAEVRKFVRRLPLPEKHRDFILLTDI